MKISPVLLMAMILLAAGFAAAPALAQGSAQIGILLSSSAGPFGQAGAACSEVLKKAGQFESIHIHSLQDENNETLRRHMGSSDPKIIIAFGTRAARFARDNVRDRPVVFSMVLGADEFKVANSAALLLSVSPGAKLKYIGRLLPNVKRVGVLYTQASAAEAEEIRTECGRMGFQFVGKQVDNRQQFPEDLKDLSWRIDCFFMLNDPEIFFPKSIEYLLANSLQENYPVVGLSYLHTKAGALLSFDFDYPDLGRQTGELALRILKGEKAEGMAPVMPEKVNISINVAVADRLGLTLPPDEVKKADKVFGR
jgi:putative tryptophan/tyrosine transport system substrate-binding protein